MISPATSEKILRNQIITKLFFSNQRTSYLSYLAKYQMNLKNNKNSFEKKKKSIEEKKQSTLEIHLLLTALQKRGEVQACFAKEDEKVFSAAVTILSLSLLSPSICSLSYPVTGRRRKNSKMKGPTSAGGVYGGEWER